VPFASDIFDGTFRTYDVWKDMFPEILQGQPARPVRVGMDRDTGKVLIGWPHVVQSLSVLFVTRYHERILRYFVGSFVPHMIGENLNEQTVTKFWWAIGTSVELWEPNYSIKYINVERLNEDGYTHALTSPEQIRRGEISFAMHGVYMPRGHLGDATPEERRSAGLIASSNLRWNVIANG
jgi:phage baseplate assembly protein W